LTLVIDISLVLNGIDLILDCFDLVSRFWLQIRCLRR
jgi:hypothetical protein